MKQDLFFQKVKEIKSISALIIRRADERKESGSTYDQNVAYGMKVGAVPLDDMLEQLILSMEKEDNEDNDRGDKKEKTEPASGVADASAADGSDNPVAERHEGDDI